MSDSDEGQLEDQIPEPSRKRRLFDSRNRNAREERLQVPMMAGPFEPMQVDPFYDIDQPLVGNELREEALPLVENATLDLEAYSSQYSGLTKVQRVLFVAERAPALRVDALRMCLQELVTKTMNTVLYQDVSSVVQLFRLLYVYWALEVQSPILCTIEIAVAQFRFFLRNGYFGKLRMCYPFKFLIVYASCCS